MRCLSVTLCSNKKVAESGLGADGEHKNMIDLILIDNSWKTAVKLCRTFQGADISSDHSLVLCNLMIKLKRIKKASQSQRRDLETLETEAVRKRYEDEIQILYTGEKKEQDLDERVLELEKIIKSAVEAVVPHTEKA